MHFSYIDPSSQALFPLKAIGKRQDIIPKHIIKWIYKEGIGDYPKEGDLILCNVGVYLIDGTQICPTSSTVTKFIYGKDALIQGLQIVLSHCQKGEVFKVKISSQYAYQDRQDVKLIPPNSCLIFQITVLNIIRQKFESLNVIEVAQQIRHLIEKSDDELRKQNTQKALQILRNAFQMSHALKYQRSPIRQKIVAKMINIRLHEKKIEEAHKILQDYISETEEFHFLLTRSKIKIYQQLGQLDNLMEQMKAKYMKYHRSQHAKRELTIYFKKFNCLQELKTLDDDLKKSQQISAEQDQMSKFYPIGMRDYFL